MEMIPAAGATPLKLDPSPDAIPATCVPWEQPAYPAQLMPDPNAVEEDAPPGHRLVAPPNPPAFE
jgi:hypothetical protein